MKEGQYVYTKLDILVNCIFLVRVITREVPSFVL